MLKKDNILTVASTCFFAYLKVVGFVVVHVERPEEFGVAAHRQLLDSSHTLIDSLPGVLLHLDVVELSEIAEPLDQLGRDAAVELQTCRGGGSEKSNKSHLMFRGNESNIPTGSRHWLA